MRVHLYRVVGDFIGLTWIFYEELYHLNILAITYVYFRMVEG